MREAFEWGVRMVLYGVASGVALIIICVCLGLVVGLFGALLKAWDNRGTNKNNY